ncbi:AAA family ATPase [Amycolatopsis sp. cmx-11-12]|uniref:helix-turn-helix transcriptional regulator n=1 Tax=Amycolatopsis sp. cmx-11-12 TaxID=2785795 RepID=UPI0039181956
MWGRTAELKAFDHALATVTGNTCQVLEIAGEPGMGKTRLLTALEERATRAGARVAHGQATASPLTNDFALFVDALEDLLAADGNQLLAELDPRAASCLPGIFPVLHPAQSAFAESPQQRYWAYQGIRSLLGKLAAGRPLVLILDDVHNAQPGSIEMILHLLRRPLNAPLLLVLAHRPRQSPAELLSALSVAVESGVARSLELGPLDAVSALRLLPMEIRPGRRRQLLREYGGKPGLLGALAAGAPEDVASADPGVLPPGPLSHPVVASVRLDLQALPALARQVAQAAAVVGDRFDSALVAEVAGLGHDRTLEGLDGLIAHDLVRVGIGNDRLAFRDPVVRSICYHHAGGGWRLGAHARAYRLLRERGAPLAELAHHLERAGKPATESDVRTLVVAVEQSGDRMPATVSGWLRTLLQLAGLGLAERQRLATRLARSTALSGLLTESLPGHRAAWQHRADLDASTLADLAESHLRVLRLLGRFEEVAELARQLDTSDGGVAARVVLGLAETSLDSGGDVAGSLARVERLVPGAEDSGDIDDTGLRALAVYSAMLATLGRGAEATAAADRAAGHLNGLADPGATVAVAVVCEVFDWLGWANLWSGRTAEALAQYNRGLALAERHRQVHVLGRLHLGLATAYLADGALGAAVEHAEDASALAEPVGSTGLQARTKRLCAEIGHVIASGGEGPEPGDSGSLCAMLAGLSAAVGRHGDARLWHALDERLGSRPGLVDRFGLTLLAAACLQWGADPDRAWRTLRAAVVVLGVRPFSVLAPLAGRAFHATNESTEDSAAEVRRGDAESGPDFDKVVLARMGLLSTRENQVAELVARGRTNQQIARALVLSHKTVETYLRRIFDKLEVSSRSEVAAFTGIMPRMA